MWEKSSNLQHSRHDCGLGKKRTSFKPTVVQAPGGRLGTSALTTRADRRRDFARYRPHILWAYPGGWHSTNRCRSENCDISVEGGRNLDCARGEGASGLVRVRIASSLADMASQTWCQAADAPGRTILFAVNDSPESFAAFAWARANLLRQQDTLVLVHAYEKDRLFGASPLLEAQQVAARFEALCKDRGVQHRVVLAQGCAAKVVAGAAHANRCDMCVMGCRGLSAVKRALIGSVSTFAFPQ